MNKLLKSIACVATGLAMAIGVGAGLGREAKAVHAAEQSISFDLTGSTNRTTISTTLIKYESNGVSFSIIKGTGTNVNNYCPGGSTNNTTQTRVYNGNSVEFKAPSNKVITKIDVTATGSSYFAGLSTVAQYSPEPAISTNGSVATATFAAASQRQTVTASTNATGRLTAIKIYYDDPSSVASISLNKTSIAVPVGYDTSFIVSTLNLTNNFSVSGGNNSYFTTSYTAAKTDGDHVVTLRGVAVTSSPITLTVSSTGATSKTISVSVEEPLIYEKVVAASSIKAGSEVIIGTTDGTSILGKYISGNNCPALAYQPHNGTLVSTILPDEYCLFTIGGEYGAWTLTDQDDRVYGGTSGENYLRAGYNDTWAISISSAGVATITSSASSRSIKKNTSGSLFAAYASGQSDISIYMVPSSTPELQVIVEGSLSLGVGETAVLRANKINGASGTVNWSTSNSSALSLSSSTGDSVTVTAGSVLGNATITASLAGCESVETEFLVRKGSAVQPYSVAEVISAIDSHLESTAVVYVSGIVSSVESLNSDNSITYWISDDGLTDEFEVYKGFNIGGVEFESLNDIEVGATVIVKGHVKKYGSDYEFSSNNELVSYTAPVSKVLDSISVSGQTTTFEQDDDFEFGGTVTATYDDESTKDVTSSQSVTFGGYDMSTVGEQTVTVSYTEGSITKQTSYVITVTAPKGTAIEETGLFVKVKSTGELVNGAKYLISYNDSLVFDGSLDSLDVAGNGISVTEDYLENVKAAFFTISEDGDDYTIQSSSGFYIGENSDANGLSSNKQTAFKNTIGFEGGNVNIISSGGAHLRYNSASDQLRFRYYKSASYSGQKPIQLYRFLTANENLASASTVVTLNGVESGEGEQTTVSSVALKFGAKIPQADFEAIKTKWGITDYGVMLIKAAASYEPEHPSSFVQELFLGSGQKPLVVNKGTYADPYLSGGYYAFNVKINISANADLSLAYYAVPFICVGGEYIFLEEVSGSINTFATDNSIETNLTSDGLNYLATH